MGRLDGKVAVITGAASGIGKETAKVFLQEGAVVAVTDINQELMIEIQNEFEHKYSGKFLTFYHDVTNEQQWAEILNSLIEKFGQIDILVNNAGITGPIEGQLENIELTTWNQVLNVNLTGTALGLKSIAPIMKQQESGSIINIASIISNFGREGFFGYSASKGGVKSLTKSAALTLGKWGIRVNSVHPGTIVTPLNSIITDNDDSEAYNNWRKSIIPLKNEFGKPEDVAYGVLYLASNESKFVTGSELAIDGGASAH